jgi:peptidoglycan/LPS O-acetylase OafA/YrhL
VAVLLVVFWHWFPQDGGINWTPNGALGVDLFFVLSGFLITSILLAFRAAVESGRKRAASALGDFYLRRGLRLFPLYYAVLIGAWLWPAGATGTAIRTDWPWYALFAQNLRSFETRVWDGFLSHFWSLAVEEQYYLLWGLAVLFVPRRLLPALAIAATASAIATRAIGVALAGGDLEAMSFWAILTPACFDGLGLGSLLALARDGSAAGSRLNGALRAASRFALFPALLLICCYRLEPALWYLLGRTAVALLALRLLFWALDGAPASRGPGRWLEWEPIVGFGRRSYGLYVFHNLVPFLLTSVTGALERRSAFAVWLFAPLQHPAVERSAWALLLLALAYGSWRWFESPINSLKHRFAP